MSEIKQYILKQVAKKNLPKEEAANLLLDLINLGKVSAQQDIAIVGMACKLPGANSPAEFWSNLERGFDAIDEFPEFRLNDILLFKDKLDQKIKTDKTFQGAFLDRIDLFDADFFGISPAEARVLDPLQRLFLSVSYHAVENAGYTKEMLNGSKMGVYVGHSSTGYKELLDEEEAASIPGNISAILASRIAYVFNLTGPTMLVDTTCSSSMVALHLACEGIMRGDCDSAIVGGGNLILYPACQDVANQSVGILASDYRSKAFDQSADGCGIGEGMVSLVIKPLKKAIQDCDNIYAVIKGSAINSDGRSNGITAPSAKAQTQVITKAWARAGIKPEQISYVEAHGTGTQLGDPIEFEGLNLAFNQYTQEKQFCAIGSLKTNIGHLDSAAGLAGILKTGLSILHHKIPSSLHFKQPNSLMDFENSALYVNQQLSEWQQGQPLLAGVSSFGLSGTNAHVVLSENLEKTTENKKDLMDDYLFVISAKSIDSLYELLVKYNICLIDTNLRPIDVSYTMLMRRNHFQYRLAFVAKNLEDLRQKISSIKLKKSNQEIELILDAENLYYGEVQETKESMGHMSSLRECAQKYIEGYKLDGSDLFGKNNVRCIELPSYSFDEKRHWVLNSQKLENLTNKRLKAYYSNTNVMHQCVSETFNFGESLISELDFNFPEGYVDDMSQFCSMLIFHLFRQLNLLSLLEKGAGFDALFLKASFTPIYKKIFKVMLNHLVADYVVSQKNETFYLNRLIDDNNIEDFLNECTQKYPELSDCFNFPYYCSKSYVDVFTGKKSTYS